MIIGIFFMIVVGISWTIYGYGMGEAPKRKVDVPVLLFLTFLIALVITIITGFVQQGRAGVTITAAGLLLAVLSQIGTGFVNFYQLFYMSKAMQKGPNGVVWSIVQSGFIFPFLAGIIFFGEILSWNRIVGFIFLLISITLFGVGKNKSAAGGWRKPAFIAFLCTGGSQVLSNLPSYYPEAAAVSGAWRTAGFACGMMIGTILIHIPDRKKFFSLVLSQCRLKALWFFCLLFEIVDIGVSVFFLYPGMDRLSHAGAGTISYPIMVSSCLIFFELFAIFVLKEKRTWRQRFALALCIAGAILLPIANF